MCPLLAFHTVAALENLSYSTLNCQVKLLRLTLLGFLGAILFFVSARSSLYFKYKSSCLSGLRYFLPICGIKGPWAEDMGKCQVNQIRILLVEVRVERAGKGMENRL